MKFKVVEMEGERTRLIDADELIKKVKKNKGLPWKLTPTMIIAFTSILYDAPTAYELERGEKNGD